MFASNLSHLEFKMLYGKGGFVTKIMLETSIYLFYFFDAAKT